MQVYIQQSHLIASLGQAQSQVDGYAGFAHPSLAAHDQEFMPDVAQLFLKMGFVFSCLGLMSGATLGALAALTSAHAQPFLWKEPFTDLLIKYYANAEFKQDRGFLKDGRGFKEQNTPLTINDGSKMLPRYR